MVWRTRLFIVFSALFLLVLIPRTLSAESAFFVHEGRLMHTDFLDAAPRAVNESMEVASGDEPVFAYHGLMAGNRPVVSLGTPNQLDSLIYEKGVRIVILSPDGGVDEVVHENAVRAWPSPDGKKLAVLTLDYSVAIYEGGKFSKLDFAPRTVLAAWSPDSSRLCLTAYPADWTPLKMNSPDGPDEFFRLHNSDLHLFDPATGSSEQITFGELFDYSPVFSPDGTKVIYVSVASGRSAFLRLDLATGETTQLTNRTGFEVPIARSDTLSWISGGDLLVYATMEADGRDSIRSIRSDGAMPRLLGYGTQPRVTTGGQKVAFLGETGEVQWLDLE